MAARLDKETREKFYGDLAMRASHNSTGTGSFADTFDRTLDKEFSDTDDASEGTKLQLDFPIFTNNLCTWLFKLQVSEDRVLCDPSEISFYLDFK